MLIYHPAQDANHCVFRALLILESSKHTQFDLNLFRLLDYYLVFPHLLKSIKPFPSRLSKFRKSIQSIPDSFESILNPKRVLHELEPLQTVALQSLLAKELLDIESYKNKKVVRSEVPLPDALLDELNNIPYRGEEWFQVIVNLLPEVDLIGSKGLKKRTGLMEFRYDVVVP